MTFYFVELVPVHELLRRGRVAKEEGVRRKKGLNGGSRDFNDLGTNGFRLTNLGI